MASLEWRWSTCSVAAAVLLRELSNVRFDLLRAFNASPPPPCSEEASEYIEIGALNGVFVLGRSMGFIGERLFSATFSLPEFSFSISLALFRSLSGSTPAEAGLVSPPVGRHLLRDARKSRRWLLLGPPPLSPGAL